jgi:uncharacterized protein (DUF1810 family)
MADLQRFFDAQAQIYEQARGELAAGRKRSHWMWFIFPQIKGLGSSGMAQRYAIADLDEAAAYLANDVLGTRLRECTELVNAIQGSSLGEIFGYPDDLKFHSCVTLFALAAQGTADTVFQEALDRYSGGKYDRGTVDRINA